MKSAYPTSGEVLEVLTAAGIASGSLDIPAAALAGRQEVERRCGRVFLASSGTRYFAPPVGTGYVDFRADLASLTSVVYQPEGGSSETLVLDTDFWLLPLNAASDGDPYTGLELVRRWVGPLNYGLHRALRITGSWGYGSTLPEDVWNAMRYAAALSLLPAYGLNISSGRIVQQEAGVIRTWGADPLGGVRNAWIAFVDRAVARYRKVRA